ncbi:uncharacterized protein NECHADRAFT_88474 [Fusarium vanettenii 77-13-4]|uniref:Uncharacterized protein n=1 Tax=Fusarium vanettenii (strain ATCC MYA-4622 / CBS 123669 / FGSC 9596 / NRRL 45880 / 77-13-4) TaxID=660122 RepID=C7ZBN6_FUSV7|nr:uncharacterized protein NECHADRAFT_88474 [Fusarium vanettenii 77-13-4]EEU38597.1 predicted protein [Fusarium vanettenii 77-13-4]
MIVNKTSNLDCCEENYTTLVEPQQTESSEAPFPQTAGQPKSRQRDLSIDSSSQVERKLDEQEIQIDILELELDQHKELLREKIHQLNERDATIKTQCFHIVALHHDVHRLTEEKERLDIMAMNLRNQLKEFERQDWQMLNTVDNSCSSQQQVVEAPAYSTSETQRLSGNRVPTCYVCKVNLVMKTTRNYRRNKITPPLAQDTSDATYLGGFLVVLTAFL